MLTLILNRSAEQQEQQFEQITEEGMHHSKYAVVFHLTFIKQ